MITTQTITMTSWGQLNIGLADVIHEWGKIVPVYKNLTNLRKEKLQGPIREKQNGK